MSFLQSADMQIWQNAVFDNGDTDEQASIKGASIVEPYEKLDSESGKENQSPPLSKSPVSVKSPTPIKPLDPNGASGDIKGKPLKLLFKQGLLTVSPSTTENGDEDDSDEGKIDAEMEEIEKEISRLASRLESLRVEKKEKTLKKVEIPKTDQKQSLENSTADTEEKHSLGLAEKLQRNPIQSNLRKSCIGNCDERKVTKKRGTSMVPWDFVSKGKCQQPWRMEITPIQMKRSGRESLKLNRINDDKVNTQRGGRRRSSSLSPESDLRVSKTQPFEQGFSTVGSKKSMKKYNGVEPKKLFKDGEKSVLTKRSIRPGRVVASRYNQIPAQSVGNQRYVDQKKKLLPEDEKGKAECGLNLVSTETRAKKRWEILSSLSIRKSMVDSPSLSIPKTVDWNSKVKTIRCMSETTRESVAAKKGRDSGVAKSVAELVGRKSYIYSAARETGASFFQALNFEEY